MLEANVTIPFGQLMQLAGQAQPQREPGFLDNLLTLLGAGRNVYDIYRGVSGRDMDLGREIGNIADPFGRHRGQYQDQLGRTMVNPEETIRLRDQIEALRKNPAEAIRLDPSYQSRLDAGQQALERTLARTGHLGSGNALIEAQRYGQDFASQEYDKQMRRLTGDYDQQISRLMQLAGVNAGDPRAAADALFRAQGTRDARLGSGIQGLMGSQVPGLAQLAQAGGGVLSGVNDFFSRIFGGNSGPGGFDMNMNPMMLLRNTMYDLPEMDDIDWSTFWGVPDRDPFEFDMGGMPDWSLPPEYWDPSWLDWLPPI